MGHELIRINSDSETIFRRFRNQISAIPQPKTYTLLQPKKPLPQPKKDDSATKKRRFRNQKKPIPKPKNPIPQPKKDDSATTIHAIQKSKSASHLRPHSTWHPLQMRRGWVGLGGVGWENNVLAAAFLPWTHLRPHSTWHRLQMRGGWGGAGVGQ